MQQVLVEYDGRKAWATPEQAACLQVLAETRGGGFATVHGYVAESGRITPTVYDATYLTRFSYKKLVDRKIAAIEDVTAGDVLELLKDHVNLSGMGLQRFTAVFAERKQQMLSRLNGKGQDDPVSLSQRLAHERLYLNVAPGVVVHLVTAPGEDGLKQPVLDAAGYPTVDSILLNVIELSRRVIEPGEYKTVNSGVPVLISNAIDRVLKNRGVRSMQRISLQPGKFTKLSISGETILPEDVVQIMD